MKLWRDRSGQGVLEYGLILGLVAMVAIGALLVLGGNTTATLARAGNVLNADPNAGSGSSPNAGGGSRGTAGKN